MGSFLTVFRRSNAVLRMGWAYNGITLVTLYLNALETVTKNIYNQRVQPQVVRTVCEYLYLVVDRMH